MLGLGPGANSTLICRLGHSGSGALQSVTVLLYTQCHVQHDNYVFVVYTKHVFSLIDDTRTIFSHIYIYVERQVEKEKDI